MRHIGRRYRCVKPAGLGEFEVSVGDARKAMLPLVGLGEYYGEQSYYLDLPGNASVNEGGECGRMTVVIVGDSMTEGFLLPWMKSHFGKVVFIHKSALPSEREIAIMVERPDIVVEERTERAMDDVFQREPGPAADEFEWSYGDSLACAVTRAPFADICA